MTEEEWARHEAAVRGAETRKRKREAAREDRRARIAVVLDAVDRLEYPKSETNETPAGWLTNYGIRTSSDMDEVELCYPSAAAREVGTQIAAALNEQGFKARFYEGYHAREPFTRGYVVFNCDSVVLPGEEQR